MKKKGAVRRRPILFVCTHNVSRSYTAEHLFEKSPDYEARSAGTGLYARVAVSEDLLAWAGQIFVMEEEHVTFLRERFPNHLTGKEIVCLEIPDIYMPMDTVLIAILCDKLAPYLGKPPEVVGE